MHAVTGASPKIFNPPTVVGSTEPISFFGVASVCLPTPEAFFAEIRSGNFEKLKSMVEQSPGLFGATNSAGVTALHLAALHGHRGVVEFLATKHPLLIPLRTSDGSTALHLAASYGHLGVAKWFAEKYPRLVAAKISDWATVLERAEKDGY